VAPQALDAFNERLVSALNDTGELFLSHTRVKGVVAIRLAIGNARTADAHVARAWALLQRHTAELATQV
jgi:aromatic-L-amino-acid/L-tryptophan decarboxylase